jgi:2-polyprenyl-3-methyl-5-hydroxy-6-metoxy-1,4-benzoquinol methylase
MNKTIRADEAAENLFSRLQRLNPDGLNISEYNKNYLRKYIDNSSFYRSVYTQLLVKALRKLDKPVHECTFVDYGGGCGILSFLAKESGFGTVVYTDINKKSLNDAVTISGSLGVPIDQFIPGDIEEFVCEISYRKIMPDLICSFDVIEHIYDLEHWFRTINGINNEYSMLLMTGANPANPFIKHRLKKLHYISEYEGTDKNITRNDIYIDRSCLEERERIIISEFPDMNKNDIKLLSKKTRGLREADIKKVVSEFILSGNIIYKINHPTNTCDPYSGSWTERLIDLKQLRSIIERNHFSVDMSNSYYAYSENKIVNIIKYILNQLIYLSGPKSLFLSPALTLEIEKQLTLTKQ